MAKTKNAARPGSTICRYGPQANPERDETDKPAPTSRLRPAKIGQARITKKYHPAFLRKPGFSPASAQSRVARRRKSATSNGAAPQRMKPGPIVLGLPPNKGATNARLVTRIEKMAISQMVFFRSAVFIGCFPGYLRIFVTRGKCLNSFGQCRART